MILLTFCFHKQVQSKYVGTGHADITKQLVFLFIIIIKIYCEWILKVLVGNNCKAPVPFLFHLFFYLFVFFISFFFSDFY